MASPVQPLRLRCHLTRHRFPKNLLHVVRDSGVESHVRKASLGHPFVPFRASPYLNTYACPPWVTPVYPGLRWLSPTGCRLLGTLPQHARHHGLIPPSGRKNGSAPRSQALLPPASRRNESPTSGNPVRWVDGKGLPGVIIPNVDLVPRSGAGTRPYHNGTWNEGAARRPQRSSCGTGAAGSDESLWLSRPTKPSINCSGRTRADQLHDAVQTNAAV